MHDVDERNERLSGVPFKLNQQPVMEAPQRWTFAEGVLNHPGVASDSDGEHGETNGLVNGQGGPNAFVTFMLHLTWAAKSDSRALLRHRENGLNFCANELSNCSDCDLPWGCGALPKRTN